MENENFLKYLFPVGEARWVKIKYLDFEKSLKAFDWESRTAEPTPNEIEKGYVVLAIGRKDEHLPQISALMDLKTEIIPILSGNIPDYMLDNINSLFKSKIEELKRYTIQERGQGNGTF